MTLPSSRQFTLTLAIYQNLKRGSIGHELHPALMDQAVTRLQSCVPLRFWKAL